MVEKVYVTYNKVCPSNPALACHASYMTWRCTYPD